MRNLPAELRKDPQRLYSALAAAANGEVSLSMLEAAEHLLRTEGESLRAAVLLAALSIAADQTDKAATVLQRARAKHGDHPALLLNLSKVLYRRKDLSGALSAARSALSADPNYELCLVWFSSLLRRSGKEAELLQELHRLCTLPGAWRPSIAIAEFQLELGVWDAAERAFQDALSGSSASKECVQLIARDLRACDRHDAMIRLLARTYELPAHGPHVGLALARAHLERGELPEATELIQRVRPALAPSDLRFLSELEKDAARLRSKASSSGEDSLRVVPFAGPIWAEVARAVGQALPAVPFDRLIAITQLADCTGDRNEPMEGAQFDPETEVERACRSLPLMLSEVLSVDTDGTGLVVLPAQGTEGLYSLRAPISFEQLIRLLPRDVSPRVAITGAFYREVTTELKLKLNAYDLLTGESLFVLELVGKSLGAIATKAGVSLKRSLFAAGLLRERPPLFSQPEDRFAERYLEVTHLVLTQVLAAHGRIGSDLVWGTGKVLEAALKLVDDSAPVETPLLLLAAAYHAAEMRGVREHALFRSDLLTKLENRPSWIDALKLHDARSH